MIDLASIYNVLIIDNPNPQIYGLCKRSSVSVWIAVCGGWLLVVGLEWDHRNKWQYSFQQYQYM